MGKHRKENPRSGLYKAFVVAGLGVCAVTAGVMFWPASSGVTPQAPTPDSITPTADPGSSSSTSTDAELPDTITLFGQDAVKKDFFFDPVKGGWNMMLLRQCNEMKDHGKRKAYFDFMKQFDDLKKQFHAAGGKSPGSIDAIIEKVNQRVSDQIKDHPSSIDDFKSPVEMMSDHFGSSQDIAAMNEAVMQYIGMSDNRLLVVRTNSQGDAGNGADLDVLAVNDAPEGTPPHFVVAVGHVNQLRNADPHPGQVAFIDARNQRGAFFTIAGPKAG